MTQKRKTRASPECPFCGDRYGLFCRLDQPAIMFCHSCSRIFERRDVQRKVSELNTLLEVNATIANSL